MIFISWNCRGLGYPQEDQENDTDEGCLIVESKVQSGGLALMWKEDIALDLKCYLQNHIDMEYLEPIGLTIRSFGDFTEIMTKKEKVGGNLRVEMQMEVFKDVDECQLYDLGFKGSWYTGTSKRHVDNKICEGLDQALVNQN
ncbi:hypothetical protein GOBAR_DD33611 [Gossypium barbadense]|nr:hypothetical protein GOBAR_DD33611 [Gossypium barbadense]